jgi:hypothetical protein
MIGIGGRPPLPVAAAIPDKNNFVWTNFPLSRVY